MVTLCNVCISGSHNFSRELVQDVLDQLLEPYILLGDFNSHNTLWGSAKTSQRGRVMEKLMKDHDCHILNNGAMTSVAYSVETAIDLSICSDSLSAIIN